MNIIIQEPPNQFTKPIYQGSDSRYPTMTDVKWLSETRLLAAHRYAGKLYILNLRGDDYEIISTYTNTHQNQLHQTEAFELNSAKNKIFLISFSEMLFILDISPQNKIQFVRSISLNSFNIPYHGIRLYQNHLFVTPSRRIIGLESIKKINLTDFSIADLPSLGEMFRIKHLAFLSDGSVLVLINYKTTTTLLMENHISSGCLRLYRSDFQTVQDTLEIPSAHLDGMTMDGNTFWVTCHDLEGGFILQGRIVEGKIVKERRISCEDFPHGIDVYKNRIAYTSYKTSGIHIRDVAELLSTPLEV